MHATFFHFQPAADKDRLNYFWIKTETYRPTVPADARKSRAKEYILD